MDEDSRGLRRPTTRDAPPFVSTFAFLLLTRPGELAQSLAPVAKGREPYRLGEQAPEARVERARRGALERVRGDRLDARGVEPRLGERGADRKSTRLNSSHANISYAVFCLKKKNTSHHLSTISIY